MTSEPTETAVTAQARPPLWVRAGSLAKAWIERLLHSGRRQAARERLQAMPRPTSVLFICEGNIYRSPFAEHCFSAALPDALRSSMRIASAGFKGPDRPSPPEAQEEARRRGIDLSQHRSVLINGAMVSEWDLVVVMEERQARKLTSKYGIRPDRILILGDLDPKSIDRRTIADPWRTPETVLEPSYARVERCVRVLLDIVASGSRSA
jgi:protein-tyrosine phosphatase